MRDLSCETIRSEVKIRLLCNHRGAVSKIADLMGIHPQSVYDRLEGKIKIKARFLHAAVIVTDDPVIKSFLEPDGYKLVRTTAPTSDKPTLDAECLDDLPALASYHAALRDPSSNLADIQIASDALIREIQENISAWKKEKKR